MENKNGQGIFYGVIGVATLVVAIIGATFAYFSAAATTDYQNQITGNTLQLAGALSVTVNKVAFSGATAAKADLVPATIATESGAPTVAGINQALEAKCEKGGYTGCHVYKITATSNTPVDVAEINLATLTTTASSNKTDWKYVIYKGSSDTTATSVVANGEMDLATPVNMHANDKTLSSTPVIYYLMIYLAEDNHATEAQNSGTSNDATGTYNGTVELTAAGGKVTANFTA